MCIARNVYAPNNFYQFEQIKKDFFRARQASREAFLWLKIL